MGVFELIRIEFIVTTFALKYFRCLGSVLAVRSNITRCYAFAFWVSRMKKFLLELPPSFSNDVMLFDWSSIRHNILTNFEDLNNFLHMKGKKIRKKRKRKMADVDCKGEKVPAFLSVRKILKKWLNLIQFCCVWILALSHQAPYKNLRFLEYWEELFLFLFWRISLTNFSIHWVSHSRLWHQRTKRLFFAF